MRRRIIALTAALCLLLGVLPGSAGAADASGTCGTDLVWSLSDGLLTISGTGEMEDWPVYLSYNVPAAPWYNSGVKAVNISPGVTSIGDCAVLTHPDFEKNVRAVVIPDTVTRIGSWSLEGAEDVLFQGTREQWAAITAYAVSYNFSRFEVQGPVAEASRVTFLAAGLPKLLSVQDGSVHFPSAHDYQAGRFSDVAGTAWYAPYVAKTYAYGLMNGTGTSSFSPSGDVTVAEAVTMAARIYSIYMNGTDEIDTSGSGPWYRPYLEYAYQHGIIEASLYQGDASQKATRSQFAAIFSKAMPGGLAEINDVPDGEIPDVPDDIAVYRLYRAGILTGSDSKGTFYPNSHITRAEAAAIVTRMADTANRETVSLDTPKIFTASNGGRYSFVIDDCSWHSAWEKAREAGGILATFWDREQYEEILAELDRRGLRDVEFRIGARRAPDSTEYTWTDEYGGSYSPVINSEEYWANSEFLEGEPSFYWKDHEEMYLSIYYNKTLEKWVWNDVADQIYSPGKNTHGYIIEYLPERLER